MYKYLILALILLTGFYIYYLNPDESVNVDIHFIRANNAFANERYDLAKKYYLKDLEVNPKKARSLNNLSITFIKGSNKNLSKVIEHYQKLINHPEFTYYVTQPLIQNFNEFGMINELNAIKDKIKSKFLLAQIYFYIDIDKAAFHITQIPDSEKNSDYHFLYGQINFSLGKYDEAVDHLNMAIKFGNMNSKLYYLKSQSLLRLRKIEESKQVNKVYQKIKSFEQNTKTAAEQLDDMRGLLNTHSEKNSIKEYKYQLLILLLLNNARDDSIALLNELDILKINNQYRENIVLAAIKSVNFRVVNALFTTSKINTMSATEAILYCQTHKDIENQNVVQSFCKDAAEKFKDSATIHFWYGVLLLNNNRIEEAIKEFSTSINYAPWMDEWRMQLAQVYLSLGDTKKAIQVIDQSISKYRVHLDQFKLNNGLLQNDM